MFSLTVLIGLDQSYKPKNLLDLFIYVVFSDWTWIESIKSNLALKENIYINNFFLIRNGIFILIIIYS